MDNEKQQTEHLGSSDCSSDWLPGCGQFFVGWSAFKVKCVNAERAGTIKLKYATPLDFILQDRRTSFSVGLRARQAIRSNNANCWQKLVAMKKGEFRSWRNYGQRSHKELQDAFRRIGIALQDY
jgi:hypothetical protein